MLEEHGHNSFPRGVDRHQRDAMEQVETNAQPRGTSLLGRRALITGVSQVALNVYNIVTVVFTRAIVSNRGCGQRSAMLWLDTRPGAPSAAARSAH